MPRPADTQLRLRLSREPDVGREPFVVSPSNQEAVELIETWPNWPGGAVALAGPEGSGKTHLGRIWAERTGAVLADRVVFEADGLPNGPVLIDDADGAPADVSLFHLLNRTEPGASVLMMGRLPPRRWTAALPDLRSRLNAIVCVEIREPDDALLKAVMMRLFRDRNIRPGPDLLAYLLRRIERSVPAAQAVVARLDEVADAGRREVTRTLAREILEDVDKTGDLFA
jgi:chromosomal replication initiation ATPase DnaA